MMKIILYAASQFIGAIKQIPLPILCMAIRALTLVSASAAEQQQEGDFTYYDFGGEIMIHAYTGPGGAVTIPDTIRGKPVAGIGSSSFAVANRKDVTSVVIPDSATYVGDAAFYDCVGLTNVVIGNRVKTIGNWAFNGCTGLTSITLPASVTDLRSAVFEDCTTLQTFIVDPLNDLYSSLDGVILDKSQQWLIKYPAGKVGSNYLVPASVTRIGDFRGSINLTNVTIHAGVNMIYGGSFAGCARLTAFTVDPLNASYSVADGVLFDKAQERLIRFPEGRTGNYNVPAGTTVIEPGAFAFCTGLTRVFLPGVQRLEGGAFTGCTSLTSANIPETVEYLGGNVFTGCTLLRSVYFEGDAPALQPKDVEMNGVLPFFDIDRVTIYYLEGGKGWSSSFAGCEAMLWVPADDLDHDGMINLHEKMWGTDPVDAFSVLALESAPRPEALDDEDRGPVPGGKHAIYFQSIPGMYYGIVSCDVLGGDWTFRANVIATTFQKRVLVDKPVGAAFYQVTPWHRGVPSSM
jgi:hypothetical protein